MNHFEQICMLVSLHASAILISVYLVVASPRVNKIQSDFSWELADKWYTDDQLNCNWPSYSNCSTKKLYNTCEVWYSIKLKTNIQVERVCSTDTTCSITALTPEHSTPHCVAKLWPVSGSTGEQTDLKIWTLAADPSPCSRVRCTHPIRIWQNRARQRHSGISVL